MGSLVKCQGCGERCGDRPTGVYWRWMRADGVWRKYYGRYCVGCYAARVLPMDVQYEGATRLTCPGCGIDTEDDYDGVYTTSFPKGRAQLDTAAPFCGACAAQMRNWIVEHARDSDSVDGAPEPHQQESNPAAGSDQVLAALGRKSRAGR